MKGKAILFTGVNEVTVGEIRLPGLEAGELLIEAAYTCISPGTELRCLAGKQGGAVAWPFIPGYSLTGRVIACGPGTTLKAGTAVLCSGTSKSDRNQMWGGHVSHAVQREGSVFPLPDGVDLADAAAAKLAAIAFHGLRLSRPLAGERVAVVGLGPLGQLSARLHAAMGARVVGGDLSPERARLATQAGIEAFVPQGSLVESFRRVFPAGADIVIDATGAPAVLPQAIALAKDVPWDDSLTPGARFIVQGSYSGDFSVPHHDAFLKELTFFLPRDAQRRDILAVLDLMQRGTLSTQGIISEVRRPEEASEVYATLRAGKGGVLTIAFQWH